MDVLLPNPRTLKIGDRIWITGEPVTGADVRSLATKRIYRIILSRNRPVRINDIDDFGFPWFTCRVKKNNGKYEWHYLGVHTSDDNWKKVLKRRVARGKKSR